MTTVDESVAVGKKWDATSYESKENLLRVVRESFKTFNDLLEEPGNWEVMVTPDWQVGDLAGHMIDVIEGYLGAFDRARKGEESPAPFGTRVMKERLNERAQSMRALPREERLKRFRDDFDQLMSTFEGLSESDWGGGMMVSHPYMGPVPPSFYPAFQLMDYGVHSWDIREALRRTNGLSADVADFLVPFMFILMLGTHDADHTPDLPHPVGFRVSGRNAGTWKVTVSNGTFQFEPSSVDDVPTVFDFDPASFVLTSFGRTRAGTAYGDEALADRYRGMFFAI